MYRAELARDEERLGRWMTRLTHYLAPVMRETSGRPGERSKP